MKHTERVQRKPMVTAIDLELVHSYRDQQRYESRFKNTTVEPVINDKNWPLTLENIKEYVASQYGGTGDNLDYVVGAETAVKPEAEHPAEEYDTVDQEMTARAPHSGQYFVNDRRTVWDHIQHMRQSFLLCLYEA
jgi:hypothetical protein